VGSHGLVANLHKTEGTGMYTICVCVCVLCMYVYLWDHMDLLRIYTKPKGQVYT
jgi:hypothetical protein